MNYGCEHGREKTMLMSTSVTNHGIPSFGNALESPGSENHLGLASDLAEQDLDIDLRGLPKKRLPNRPTTLRSAKET